MKNAINSNEHAIIDLSAYTVEALTIEEIEIKPLSIDGDGERIGQFDLIRLGE